MALRDAAQNGTKNIAAMHSHGAKHHCITLVWPSQQGAELCGTMHCVAANSTMINYKHLTVPRVIECIVVQRTTL